MFNLSSNNNPHRRDYSTVSELLKARTVALDNRNQFRTQLIRSRRAGADNPSLCTLSACPPPVWRLATAQSFNLKLSAAINHPLALQYPGIAADVNQYSALIDSIGCGERALEGMHTGSGFIEFSGGRIRS